MGRILTSVLVPPSNDAVPRFRPITVRRPFSPTPKVAKTPEGFILSKLNPYRDCKSTVLRSSLARLHYHWRGGWRIVFILVLFLIQFSWPEEEQAEERAEKRRL